MKAHPCPFSTLFLIILVFLFPGLTVAEDIDATLPDSNNTSSFQVKNSESTNNVLMKVQSGGNVGIGTTTPAADAKLDVNGNVQISGTSGKLVFPASHYDAKVELFKGGEEKIGTAEHQLKLIAGGSESAGNIAFFGGSTEVMRVETDGGKVGIGTSSPNSTLQVNGSFSVKYSSISATDSPYSTDGDAIIGVNTTGAVTVTLSNADCVAGRILYIKDETNGGYPILVNTQSGVNIDDATSKTISAFGALKVYSNGSQWFVLAEYNPG